jgi:hypothetical protein
MQLARRGSQAYCITLLNCVKYCYCVSDAYQELDPASKLVLVASLRPDRLLTCIEKFICGEVGEQFVEKCELDLSTIVEESPPSAPLVIIADEKIDVVTALESLGRIIGVNVRLIFHTKQSESAR